MKFKLYYKVVYALIVLAAGLGLLWAGQTTLSNWVFLTGVLLGTIQPTWAIVKQLAQRHFGVDIIAVVAILASLLIGEYIAAAVILVMLTGGEALESYAMERARRELTELMKHSPKQAHLKEGSAVRDVAVTQVAIHDTIEIRAGETVPVDCKIIEGSSTLDESAITGESLPVEVSPGQEILSGSINQSTLLIAQAVHTSKDSQYEQIVSLVRSAASSKSPIVRLADRYSVPFTIVAFSIAGLAWALSGQLLRGVEVLVVATPCPLLIATPVAIVAGMSRSARYGIVMKSGAALERLARAQAIAFDKTGTLTLGRLSIDKIVSIGMDQDKLLQITASAQANSNHILATTLVSATRKQAIKLLPTTKSQETAGNGVEAMVNKKSVLVGKREFLIAKGVHMPKSEQLQRIGEQTNVFVAIDGQLAGAISFSDLLQQDTKRTMQALHRLGIAKILMLTGDHKAIATRIAHDVGIDEVHAELLPADKLKVFEHHARLKNYQPLAMVGDGINDAPTLAAAPIGIALGSKGSTTVASESADVVIIPHNINRVAIAVWLAKRAITIAKQSIFVGIGLSIVLMFVATTGAIKPVEGAILQELIDVLVILNALRVAVGKHIVLQDL